MKKTTKPKKVMVTLKQGDQEIQVEKPTLAQTGWVLQKIAEAITERPSFRQFIYGMLDYPRPEEPGSEGTYVILYLAGGMEVTNTLFNCTDERFIKLEAILKSLRDAQGDILLDNPRGSKLVEALKAFEEWEKKSGSQEDIYLGKRGGKP